MEDISHREIYDRLIAVERKVDTISTDTKDVVNAFNSAKGAFLVFEWIGKLASTVSIIGHALRTHSLIHLIKTVYERNHDLYEQLTADFRRRYQPACP